MKWWEIVLCIVINAIWVVPMIIALVIEPLIDYTNRCKANKAWVQKHGRKLKLLCLDCKYCKSYVYHPFYKYGAHGNLMAMKLPSYTLLQVYEILIYNMKETDTYISILTTLCYVTVAIQIKH